ncbi:MAG: hypothetical protein WCR30_02985 [Clostridia bacterium]
MKIKKNLSVIVVCALFLALSFLGNIKISSFAEQVEIMPSDQNLIDAISEASGGFNAEDPRVVDNLEVLDLSNKNIDSILNLNYWTFTALKTLNLSSNHISSVLPVYFSTMPNLIELNISNNKMSSFNLSGLTLKTLYAEDNMLTSVNLNCFSDEANTVANLCSNRITSIENVTNSSNINLPTVWLACNEITIDTEIVPTNFELVSQGAKEGKKFVTSGSIEIFESLTFPNLKVQYGETILSLGINNFSYGPFNIDFYDGDTLINSNYLKGFSFSVIPVPATIKYVINNLEVSYESVFTSNVKLVFETSVPDATIFFKLGSGAWVQGTEFTLNRTGNFNITTEIRINNVASETFSTMVSIKKVPTFWFFLGFLLFMIILFVLFFGFYYYTRSKKWRNK